LRGGISLAGAGGLASDLTQLGAFSTSAGQFLVSGRNSTTAVDVWKVQPNGSILHLDAADALAIPGVDRAELSDLKVVGVGDRQILLTASGAGNFVSTRLIETNGTLGRANIVWSNQGTGMNAPQHLDSVTVAGVTYVVVGASQSSSLSLFRLTQDGALIPADHIIDELSTRFSRVSALETLMVDGRAYVFAGGEDDGISVFTVMPDGQLLHLATLADTNDRSLADVSAIAAMEIGGSIALFVSSRTETGITQLLFEPGQIGQTATVGAGRQNGTGRGDLLRASAGTTQIVGGAGDDILIAGPSPVTLTGGPGADIFVAAPVTGKILISDFTPGTDRLDLSGLGMIRSTLQLSFRVLTDGIMITFGQTQIQIRTADKTPLAANYFNNALFPVAHYDLAGMRTSMLGTSGNDTLNAGAFGSTGHGLAGRDLLNGNAGPDLLSGGAGDDTINGAGGDDTLLGDYGNDLLMGGAGNDRISGGLDQDTIFGGAGNDTIMGEVGNDMLYGELGNDLITDPLGDNAVRGGEGNDTITTGTGRDRIWGENGNDSINSGAGNDQIWGGDGHDWITGGTGNDTIFGGTGNDTLLGADGNDIIDGGPGNNNINGQNENDRLLGGTGNDTIIGGAGNDTILGGGGQDTLNGQDGNDLIRGGAGNDLIQGLTGNDILYGEAGNDLLIGGEGNDLIHGDGDSDRLDGGAGNDSLFGDAGNDQLVDLFGHNFLSGGTGNDVLRAGPGNDRLQGGPGSDHLTGGAGADLFVFRDPHDYDRSRDVITDFAHGPDHLDMAGLGLRFIGEAEFSAARQVRAYHSGSAMIVEADLNGDGHADLTLQLNSLAALTRGDFLL